MVVLTNLPPPTTGVKHEQPGTVALINDKEIGKGTLFITESQLSWVNNGSGKGFSLEYPHIALHAISRDLQTYPQECLYMMLDSKLPADDNEVTRGSEGSSDSEESSADMTEVRFVPDDKGMLVAMYHAMCECQSLHPDPPENDAEDGDEIFEDADEEEGDEERGFHLGAGDAPIIINNSNYMASNGNAASAEEPMEIEAGQFEDADGDPEN